MKRLEVVLALLLISAAGAWGGELRIPTLVEGRGTAGTPVGGVLNIQGVPGGTPVPISGGGGITDVNLIQIQGNPPSATNPLASRLSNGIGFIDPRDRNWQLTAPGDSVLVSGTITANQGGAWTMSATQGTSPWVVSGTVTSNQGGAWTVEQGTPPWSVSQSGTWTVEQGTPPWSVSGTVTSNQGGAPWTIRLQDATGGTLAVVTAAGALKVDGSAVTQPVSGTVSISGTVTVSGTVTSNQGGAWTVQQGGAPWSVSQSGSWTVEQGTPPWSVSGTVTSNQGGAPWSMRLQDGVGATLATVTAGNALKVDGSAVTQPISAASLPLPAGAAQEHVTAGSPHAVRLTDGTTFYKATTPADTQPVSGTVTANQGSPTTGANAWPTATVDTSNTIVKPGDAANNAVRVNVVSGGAGGGVAQMQVRNSADTNWVNVGVGAETASMLHVPVRIQGTGANVVEPLNTSPTGTEYAVPTRNIPSGTQPVSGTVTANQGSPAATANAWPTKLTDGTNTTVIRSDGSQRVDGAGNTLATNQVSVGAAVTQIVAARSNRKGVLIVNHGTTNVFVGVSGVTTGTGLLLTGTPGAALSMPTNAAVFGIVVSGSQIVSYMEVYD